jgi:hypothetical protein
MAKGADEEEASLTIPERAAMLRPWIAAAFVVGVLAPSGFADHDSPSAYSRWNYWAPTLVRVKAHFEPKTIPLYAADRYPEIPNPVGVVRYRDPAVPPPAYYRGTGLSYDPLGPFMAQPNTAQPAAK